MHRTEGTNYNELGGKNYFTDGPPGTCIEEDWLNAVQEELAYIIEEAGLTLDTASTETSQQLLGAFQAGTLSLTLDDITAEGVLYIKERASADSDIAGYGQLWVKNTTPCELWFTDDAGTDTQIV